METSRAIEARPGIEAGAGTAFIHVFFTRGTWKVGKGGWESGLTGITPGYCQNKVEQKVGNPKEGVAFGIQGRVTYVAAGADAVEGASVALTGGPLVAGAGITGIYLHATVYASPARQTSTVRPVKE